VVHQQLGAVNEPQLFIGDDPRTGGLKLPGERAIGSGPTGNLISGNHIHHIGLVYAHVAGFYADTVHENVISHNYIHDVQNRYGFTETAGNFFPNRPYHRYTPAETRRKIISSFAATRTMTILVLPAAVE
jgi:hypothetical protein